MRLLNQISKAFKFIRAIITATKEGMVGKFITTMFVKGRQAAKRSPMIQSCWGEGS